MLLKVKRALSMLFSTTPDAGCDAHAWRQEACECMERVQQHRQPPPFRDESAYGPRGNNPEGDQRFRRARVEWYEEATGESLDGVSLAEQWKRVDRVARAFRAHTRDGRPGRSGDAQ